MRLDAAHLLLQAIGTGGPQSSGRSPFPNLGRRASPSNPAPSSSLCLRRQLDELPGNVARVLDPFSSSLPSCFVFSPSRRPLSPQTPATVAPPMTSPGRRRHSLVRDDKARRLQPVSLPGLPGNAHAHPCRPAVVTVAPRASLPSSTFRAAADGWPAQRATSSTRTHPSATLASNQRGEENLPRSRSNSYLQIAPCMFTLLNPPSLAWLFSA
jgi:hypothetical protein